MKKILLEFNKRKSNSSNGIEDQIGRPACKEMAEEMFLAKTEKNRGFAAKFDPFKISNEIPCKIRRQSCGWTVEVSAIAWRHNLQNSGAN